MDIINFYKSVLADLNVDDPNDSGLLVLHFDGSDRPVTVEGTRMALPTDEILRRESLDGITVFHPMAEAANMGESGVLKMLKDIIMLRCMYVIQSLVDDLGHVAASHDKHKKLGSKAARFLDGLGDFDDSSYKALQDVLKNIGREPDKRLFSIFLKRSSRDDDTFIRKAVVSFPIFDELDNGDLKTLFGVKMPRTSTKVDKMMIKRLFEYVLGDQETRALYSYGSMDKEAPYLHALLTAFYKIATQTNRLVTIHRKHLKDPDALMMGLEWADFLDNFALYRGVIPPQRGNKGESLKEKKPADGKGLGALASRRSTKAAEKATASSDRDQDVDDDIPFDDPKPRTLPYEGKTVNVSEPEPARSSDGITLAEIRRMREEESAPRGWEARRERERRDRWGSDDRDRDRDRDRSRDRDRGSRDRSSRSRDRFI